MGLRPAGGLALLLGLAPLFRLAHQSFWYDELFTLFVARRPFLEVFEQARADGFTPPLYYLLVKLAGLLGLPESALRLVSVAFGALFLLALGQLATRLGGERVALIAVLLAGTSPFFFMLAQELRPYTAFLAAATLAADGFLEWRGGGGAHAARAWWLGTFVATLFSYLGFALVAAGLAGAIATPARRRQGLLLAASLAVACAIFSAAGLEKGRFLMDARAARGELAAASPLDAASAARLLLGGGYRPEPSGDDRDRGLGAVADVLGYGLVLASLALGAALGRRALAWIAPSLLFAVASVFAADVLIGIGVTTRYLSVAFPPFVLTLSLFAVALGRAAPALVLTLLAVQGMALERYLFELDYARDDWRGAMTRLAEMHRPGDLVLGFPGHHVAVALEQYGPAVEWRGGFAGRRGGPFYLYRPGLSFRGYDFTDQLEELGPEAGAVLRERAGARRVLLVSYADDDWHGDMRPILEAWNGATSVESFPARETILIRVLGR